MTCRILVAFRWKTWQSKPPWLGESSFLSLSSKPIHLLLYWAGPTKERVVWAVPRACSLIVLRVNKVWKIRDAMQWIHQQRLASRCWQWCLPSSVSSLPAWGKADLSVPAPGKWLLVYSETVVRNALIWGGKEKKTERRLKWGLMSTNKVKVRNRRFKTLMTKTDSETTSEKTVLMLREASKDSLLLSPGCILWTLSICVALWTLNPRMTFHFPLSSPGESVLCDEHSLVLGSSAVMWLSVTPLSCTGQSLPTFTYGTH